MATYITIGDVISNQVLASTYLNQMLFNMELLSKHDHSPSSGEGNKIIVSSSGASALVSQMYFSPGGANEFFSSSTLSVGAASEIVGGNIWGLNFVTDASLNNGADIQLSLLKGIYKLQIVYLSGASSGKVNLTLNSSTLTALDTYSATTGSGIYAESNLSIPSSGSFALRVAMTTKNASSAGCTVKLGPLFIYKTSNG